MLAGSDGDKTVSPAKTQLKRLADRLSDEDAGVVNFVVGARCCGSL